jgi:hypothetical protein
MALSISESGGMTDERRATRHVYLECLRAMGAIRRMYARRLTLPAWSGALSHEALMQEFRSAANGARRLRLDARRLP